MNYEIDFIGVKEHTKDALAVCLRWYCEQAKRYIVVVYDGGFKIHGEALVDILKKYYFTGDSDPTIDIVFCSHSDGDHATGLLELFDHFKVTNLVVNRPWMFSDELFPYVDDGRKTKNSVEKELKEKYASIASLEEKAIAVGAEIYDGFTTTGFSEPYSSLKILSPTKELYLELLVESAKTPYTDPDRTEPKSEALYKRIISAVRKIVETWTSDTLRDNVSTTAENETSIILFGDMITEKFLLTGDAGIRALGVAADYAEENDIDLTKVGVHQIPHHGGRHNVSPKILNQIVGAIVAKESTPTKQAFVSIGKDSDHPNEMVTNAYIRRGVDVFEARVKTIHHHIGNMPEREGWTSATKKEFSSKVDDWN